MPALNHDLRAPFQAAAVPSLPASDVIDFRGYFRVEVFSAGQVIYGAGQASEKIYLLRSGRVRLLDTAGHRYSVHAILKPGDLFGDVFEQPSAIHDEQAESSGPSEVWSIETRDFRALLEARPALAVEVVRALGERVRTLQERVVGLTRKDVPARLAQTLIALAGAVGDYEGRTRALHGVTQQDLADLVGASRSFVSTLINQLKREGVLASHGRALLVRDEEALAKVAAG
jgi:CRP/FNR family transcriptional regulator, cyclic AMP receptor protein